MCIIVLHTSNLKRNTFNPLPWSCKSTFFLISNTALLRHSQSITAGRGHTSLGEAGGGHTAIRKCSHPPAAVSWALTTNTIGIFFNHELYVFNKLLCYAATVEIGWDFECGSEAVAWFLHGQWRHISVCRAVQSVVETRSPGFSCQCVTHTVSTRPADTGIPISACLTRAKKKR